jgi:hypothetical protein
VIGEEGGHESPKKKIDDESKFIIGEQLHYTDEDWAKLDGCGRAPYFFF